MTFTLPNLLLSLLLAALTAMIWLAPRRWPDIWRRLPRERVIGEVIAVVCLVWSAYYVLPMLEGRLMRYQPVVKLLVPVTAILSYVYLNYLLARAFGALFLLTATYLLHAAFAVDLPARPLYAILCYAIAAVGMVLLATPWRFRDILEKTSTSRVWRRNTTGVLSVVTLILAVYTFFG